MSRLVRPYIPLPIRAQVAERQCAEKFPRGFLYGPDDWHTWRDKLAHFLNLLFEGRPYHLDHDPALMNRSRSIARDGTVTYSPDANDPRFLVYRLKEDHDIKTRVRGDGAQLSDQAIARKRKRKERKAQKLAALKTFRALGKKPRAAQRKMLRLLERADALGLRTENVEDAKRFLGLKSVKRRGWPKGRKIPTRKFGA